MKNFTKTINPVKVLFPWCKKHTPVFCTISFKDGRLSISGVEGPFASGDCAGAAGQIDMGFGAYKNYDPKFSSGWDSKMFNRFRKIWKDWHLNDMHAECVHQEKLGWKYNTHAGQKCPECAYEIGTAWTSREVPEEVLEFLFNLPEASIRNPWAYLR